MHHVILVLPVQVLLKAHLNALLAQSIHFQLVVKIAHLVLLVKQIHLPTRELELPPSVVFALLEGTLIHLVFAKTVVREITVI